MHSLVNIILSLLLLFTTARADLLQDINRTPFNAPVIDQAGLFSATEQQSLNQVLQQIYRDTTVQIGLMTIASLENNAIEAVAIKIAEKWRLGSEKADNGVLILIAKNDRQVRIEVGQGLEGSLTDAYSKRIIDGDFIPHFRNGDFYSGVLAGLGSILGYVAPDYNFDAPTPQVKKQPTPSLFNILVGLFIFGFLLFTRAGRFILMTMLLSGRGGGYHGGRSGGGYSGGGGGFSGGGASGRW